MINKFGVVLGFKSDEWELVNLENINMDDASDRWIYKKHSAAIIGYLKNKKNGQTVLVCAIHTFFKGLL